MKRMYAINIIAQRRGRVELKMQVDKHQNKSATCPCCKTSCEYEMQH